MRSALNIKYIAISGTNVGGGTGMYKKISPSNNMNFKTLVPAGGVSIISDNNTITISSSGGTGGNVVIEQVTVNSTVLDNNTTDALVDTSSTSMTVFLPVSPTVKKLTIKDKSGNGNLNNITIHGNGNNIDGASTATIGTNYGGVQLLYSTADGEWFIIGFVN
jgi:hypothetical protein